MENRVAKRILYKVAARAIERVTGLPVDAAAPMSAALVEVESAIAAPRPL